MAMLSFCGIDVSKDRLDVVVLPQGWFFSVSNDTAGWAELVVRLRPLTVSAIGLEPSGGYERGIIRALLAAGLFAVATGAGAEMRQSLGTAVLFGMLGVTCFGLLFTPAFYTFIRKLGRKEHGGGLPEASAYPT